MGINIPAKTDYSTLFASANTSSRGNSVSDLSGLLGEYNSIKTGSYGKLLKAYYAKDDIKSTSGAESKDNKKPEKLNESEETTAYNKVSTTADALTKSIDDLSKVDVSKDEDAKKAVGSFVKNYNNFIKASEDVDSVSIDGRVKTIKNNTATYSKQLAKLGITVDKEGKMSLDEDTFANADKSDISSLFAAKSSYGYSVKVSAGMAASNANYEATKTSLYTSNGTYNPSVGSLMDSIT